MSARWPSLALGDPEKIPLIFLHGFLGSHQDWLQVARVFSQDYYCILPDLPGHGENQLTIATQLNFKYLNKGLLKLIDDLELKKPVLIGYSLGGRTALNFASNHTDKLRALVLESTSPGISNPTEREQRAALDDLRAKSMLTDGLSSFLQTWYSAGLWASLDKIPHTRNELIRRRQDGNAEDLARVIADLSPGRMESIWERLDQISIPTLLLAGALDTKYTDIIQRSANLLPDSHKFIIKQAGHNIHLEQPDAFIHKVRVFLSGLPVSS